METYYCQLKKSVLCCKSKILCLAMNLTFLNFNRLEAHHITCTCNTYDQSDKLTGMIENFHEAIGTM